MDKAVSTDLISEDNFKALCEAADKILKGAGQSPEILSFPWLHVLRAHPQNIPSYTEVFDNNFQRQGIVKSVRGKIRIYSGVILSLVRALLANGSISRTKSIQADVIIISHLLKTKFNVDEEDFYLGGLQQKLLDKNLKVFTAYINHTSTSPHKITKNMPDDSCIVGYPDSLSQEMNILGRLKKLKPVIQDLCQVTDRFAHALGYKMLRNRFAGNVRQNLRYHLQLSELISRLNPKYLIFTYEGHAWERLAILAAKSCSSNVRCIGYMHAALFEYQHAAFRQLGEKCDPDIIAVTGSAPEKILKDKLTRNDWLDVKTVVLGSKHIILPSSTNLKKMPTSQVSACLVVPEGVLSECVLLFKYSLECARKHPETKFIWRLHPLMSFSEIVSGHNDFGQLPSNIILSDASLVDDIRLSSCVLYRGSTAVFDAVVRGLRPLYLEREGELSIDPLFPLNSWRINVRTVEDYDRAIAATVLLSDRAKEEKAQAVVFCESYRIPFQEHVILEDVA